MWLEGDGEGTKWWKEVKGLEHEGSVHQLRRWMSF